MRPAGLLFDWDNTLVDSWEVIHKALEETFIAMGETPWSLQECKEKVRASAREAFPLLFGERAPQAAKVFYDAFRRSHIEKLHPLPEAEDLLQRLTASGRPLGIVSNKSGDLLRAELVALGWQLYFTAVVGAHDAPRDKPAPDPVHMALASMGLQASREVWFVGDTDVDMVCAVAAGCAPVLLRPHPPGKGEFAGCTPTHYVASCGALGQLIFD